MPSIPYLHFIGIDPGKEGGLVSLHGPLTNLTRLLLTPMPPTEKDIEQWFFRQEFPPPYTVAMIEVVHSMPKQGVRSMFTFGQGYGFLRGCIISAGIRLDEVAPKEWQRAFKIAPKRKSETKTHWKNRIRGKAQQLFPNVDISLETADALLIALYCKRKYKGAF